MKKLAETNIIPSINYLMTSIPENLTDIEKIRYLYVELGKIFSYDYRMTVDQSVAKEKIDYSSNSISRYQTCTQISEILSILINNLECNCKAKVVKRNIEGVRFENEHVCVEVEFNNGIRILLDLTLDLYTIQSGMKTKYFGYITNATNDYDIISLKECKEMDKKLGFILDTYTDDLIYKVRDDLEKKSYEGMEISEIINYKILTIKDILMKNFRGVHESTRYFYEVLNMILKPNEMSYLRLHNLTFDDDNNFYMVAVYSFIELGLYYSFSNEFSFSKLDLNTIKNLLNNGWKTNSTSLNETINNKSL